MFGKDWQRTAVKTLIAAAIAACLLLGLVACGGKSTLPASDSSSSRSAERNLPPENAIAEVSPPAAIQELHQVLDIHQPQVKILNPQPGQVLQDDSASVEVQVQDLPIFKDEKLGLGPHLHIILDNTLDRDIYDLTQPLILSDLSPGTHTLRVFASRPWHESFKNEGAYAQTTFHIFTPTPNNTPNPTLPLLTYSRPTGTYGAEPVMLDFYLTNAPLHFVAQENAEDDIIDWRIRCTIDGQSFVLDRWHPLYLTGLKPGKNWVKLEFLDEFGNPIENVFNTTARTIVYEPGGNDTLSQLVTGKLSATAARRIVDPNFIESLAPEADTTPPEEQIPSVPETVDNTQPAEETITPEAESLPAEEEAVPAGEPTEIPETESLPAEEETVPAGESTEIPETESLPAEVEAVPAGESTEIPETESLPAEEETVPTGESTEIPETESLPAEEETVPAGEPTEIPETESLPAGAEAVPPIAPAEEREQPKTAPSGAIPFPLDGESRPDNEFSEPGEAEEKAIPESEPLPVEEAPILIDEFPQFTAPEESIPESEPLPVEEAPIPTDEFPQFTAPGESIPEPEPLPVEEVPISTDELPEAVEQEETAVPDKEAAPIEEDVAVPESAPIEASKTGVIQTLTQGVHQFLGRFLGGRKDATVEQEETAVPGRGAAPVEEDVATPESALIEETAVPERGAAPIEEDVATPESAPIEASKTGVIQTLTQGVHQFFGRFLGETIVPDAPAPDSAAELETETDADGEDDSEADVL